MSKVNTPVRRKPAIPQSASAPKTASPGGVAADRRSNGPEGGSGVAGKVAVRTKTLRLEPNYEDGLVMLKGVLNKPINKMINEAVARYIEWQTARLESELTTTLEELQAYRRADPTFAAARQAFIDGEAAYGKDDPMEGRVVRVERPADAPAPTRFVSRTRAAASEPATNRAERGTRQRS